jgi:hypothetical protein
MRLVAIALGLTLLGGVVTVLARGGDDSPADRPAAGRSPGPGAAPPTRIPVHPTGRGHGYARVIPCYTLIPSEIAARLGSPMGLGQRAAGSEGDELTGFAREDCYWFATKPTGPWVVVGTLTSTQLHDRGLGSWSARRYFLQRPGRPQNERTYLSGIGDAAYRFGRASAAVLVGDVYLDVTVVGSHRDPARAVTRLVRELGRLHITGP